MKAQLDRYTYEMITTTGVVDMHKLDRITINPEMMMGQPCIRNTRLTVKRVLEGLAIYSDWEELMAEYPGLEREDIRQALELAAHSLDDEVIRLGVA